LVASCLRGALPPVDLRAVCFVRAIVESVFGCDGRAAASVGFVVPPRRERAESPRRMGSSQDSKVTSEERLKRARRRFRREILKKSRAARSGRRATRAPPHAVGLRPRPGRVGSPIAIRLVFHNKRDSVSSLSLFYDPVGPLIPPSLPYALGRLASTSTRSCAAAGGYPPPPRTPRTAPCPRASRFSETAAS